MGVPTLWKELEAAEDKDTIVGLATMKFKASPGVRGLRLGIDASLWLFHAKKMTAMDAADVGPNAGIRNHFYRIADLISQGCLLLFVFDGPGKPAWKRGQKVGGGQSFGSSKGRDDVLLRELIEVLGQKWKRAPGEAEAELAAMANRGQLDAVLTDDVDTLLFGAPLVIRNTTKSTVIAKPVLSPSISSNDAGSPSQPAPSNSSATLKDLRRIYSSQNILESLQLDREGLILVALLSGGDYCPQGMLRCGTKIATALARGGFARSLLVGLEKYRDGSVEQKVHFAQWREEVAVELRDNPRKLLDRKAGKLASEFVGKVDFPDVSVVRYYTEPNVSTDTSPLVWDSEIDVAALVEFCQRVFEWGNIDLPARFRSLVYKPLFILEMRQRRLFDDAHSDRIISTTPYQTQYSGTLYTDIRDLKNSESTLNVMSYRVTLDPLPFAKKVNAALPLNDPHPLAALSSALHDPDDPTSSPQKARRAPKDYGASISPYTHWIPIPFVECHPDGRAAVKRWKEKKLNGSPKKKKSSNSTAGSSKAKLGFGASKVGVAAGPKKPLPSVSDFFSPSPSPTKKDAPKKVISRSVVDEEPDSSDSDGDLPNPSKVGLELEKASKPHGNMPKSPKKKQRVAVRPALVVVDDESDSNDSDVQLCELGRKNVESSVSREASRESSREVVQERKRWEKCETLELSP